MAHLTQPIKFTTKTQQGEITVNLNLNIQITGSNIGISVDDQKKEKVDFEVPDFDTGTIIEFGK